MSRRGVKKRAKAESGTSRREFISLSLRSLIGAGLLGLYIQGERAESAPIRPPSALPEDRFLGSCLRCGLCAKDCPYDAIRMATPGSGIPTGTPYLEVRKIPCYMCEDIPCQKACPSGSLDRSMEDIAQARMGLAILHDQETCLAYLGQRCEVCYRACPLQGTAMTVEYKPGESTAYFLPIVHSEACTGCGFCEHVCILDEPAIKVFDLGVAKGVRGKHYRDEVPDAV